MKNLTLLLLITTFSFLASGHALAGDEDLPVGSQNKPLKFNLDP